MLTAEVVCKIDDTNVINVVLIDEQSYPLGWAYSDSADYYGKLLRKTSSISIILKDDGRQVGFLIAIPNDNAVAELVCDDPLMEHDSDAYYIENVAILPSHRNKGGFRKMFEILRLELKKRNIFKISLHARVSNNLSKNIQDNMNVIKVRRIKAWKYYNFNETTDYIFAVWPTEKESDQ